MRCKFENNQTIAEKRDQPRLQTSIFAESREVFRVAACFSQERSDAKQLVTSGMFDSR